MNHGRHAVTTRFRACSHHRRTGDREGVISEIQPASIVVDHQWLRAQLDLARRLYGQAPERVLGTVWWYSVSSVLLAQPLERLFNGVPVDPSLEAMTLRILPDGRFVEASSHRPLAGGVGEFGRRLHAVFGAVTKTVAAVSGAGEPALWAIATDSVANRLLSAGQAAADQERAVRLAAEVAEAVGPELPRPRFAEVGPHLVVRRASCCLIDRTPVGTTCASCPNQHPDERARRIRRLLG